MRLFVALPADDAVRSQAMSVCSDLKRAGADVKWVEPENLHWTLHFFGETPEEKLGELRTVLGETAASQPPFELSLGRAGAFPSAASPKIVWLGVEQGGAELNRLAARLEAALKAKGYPIEDRPFSAHLTLGRVRSPRGCAALTRELESSKADAKTRAERLVLMRSRLGSPGPAYSELFSAPFGGAA